MQQEEMFFFSSIKTPKILDPYMTNMDRRENPYCI